MQQSLRRFTACLCFTAIFSLPAIAQEAPAPPRSGELIELLLKDGSRVFGTIEREDDREIVFRAHSGAVLTARRADVVSLRRVRGVIQDGEFHRSDVQRTRLFFAPTARSLDRGQVSFGVFEITAPFIQIGVTDRFSVGGGTPLMFGLDEGERPFWITPKLQLLDRPTRKAAVGVMHVFASGENAGIAYGVGTFGTSDNAFTIGAGMAYTEDDRNGVVMIGGESRARSNIKFITENYVFRGGAGVFSGGVRFIGERLSADVGLAVPWGVDDFFVAFPVVNFVYVF
jgi:hypothetical protein